MSGREPNPPEDLRALLAQAEEEQDGSCSQHERIAALEEALQNLIYEIGMHFNEGEAPRVHMAWNAATVVLHPPDDRSAAAVSGDGVGDE